MLPTIERMVPVMAMCCGSTGASTTLPSSTLMSTPSGRATDRLPFGPLTPISPAWMLISTPFGRAIGFLAIRDIVVSPSGHEAQDLAADALLARLRIGHDALGSGNDGDAQAVEHLGQVVLAAVLAQARARVALHVLDDRLALVVLEFDLELALGAVLDHAEVGDVAFVLEDAGDRRLHPGPRHLHRRLADGGRIPHADQHVGDWISHAHDWFPASISGKDLAWGLPGGLAQARHVAAHGRLAQLVPAQAELLVHGARAPGQGAAGGLAGRRGVARQLLQPGRGLHLLVVAGRFAGDDLLQLLALGGMLGRQLRALGLAVDH